MSLAARAYWMLRHAGFELERVSLSDAEGDGEVLRDVFLVDRARGHRARFTYASPTRPDDGVTVVIHKWWPDEA